MVGGVQGGRGKANLLSGAVRAGQKRPLCVHFFVCLPAAGGASSLAAVLSGTKRNLNYSRDHSIADGLDYMAVCLVLFGFAAPSQHRHGHVARPTAPLPHIAAAKPHGGTASDVLELPYTVRGAPLDPPPPPPVRMFEADSQKFASAPTGSRVKVFGPPSAGTIGGPWEEVPPPPFQTPAAPPLPPPSNTPLGTARPHSTATRHCPRALPHCHTALPRGPTAARHCHVPPPQHRDAQRCTVPHSGTRGVAARQCRAAVLRDGTAGHRPRAPQHSASTQHCPVCPGRRGSGPIAAPCPFRRRGMPRRCKQMIYRPQWPRRGAKRSPSSRSCSHRTFCPSREAVLELLRLQSFSKGWWRQVRLAKSATAARSHREKCGDGGARGSRKARPLRLRLARTAAAARLARKKRGGSGASGSRCCRFGRRLGAQPLWTTRDIMTRHQRTATETIVAHRCRFLPPPLPISSA